MRYVCREEGCFAEAIRRTSEGICPLHEHALRRHGPDAYCDRIGIGFAVTSDNPDPDFYGPGPLLTWSTLPLFPGAGYVWDVDSPTRPDSHLLPKALCAECSERR
ncbi:MAG: hypothetical protein FWC87_00160 [Acidimicrobiaceae bacterium]|nr:hypothetical protein [Acidimicrobiaceae bacterium]